MTQVTGAFASIRTSWRQVGCGGISPLILDFGDTRVVPKVMNNFFFFACELGTADEGECGGIWNQLLCYP